MVREAILAVCPSADSALVSLCPRCGSADHGPLRAVSAPVVVSVSYSGPHVAVAVAPSASVTALGIDIERGDPFEVLHDLAPLFSPADPPTRRGWTAIEAAVKADGRGLNVSPERVHVVSGRATVPGNATSFEIRELEAPYGVTATLAFAP